MLATSNDEAPESHHRSIHPLIKSFSIETDVLFASCLDVGCGRSRYDRWFEKFDRTREPRRYVGAETDPDIIDELRAAGVEALTPTQIGTDTFDLSLAIEVIEHLTPDETPPFLDFIEARTSTLFALTTPNIEYWRMGGTGRDNRNVASFKPIAGYEPLRWIPDHTYTYDPASADGHVHKQLFSPETLKATLQESFVEDEWDVEVFKAWPWRIADLTRPEHAFVVFFKLFALAQRRDQMARPG